MQFRFALSVLVMVTLFMSACGAQEPPAVASPTATTAPSAPAEPTEAAPVAESAVVVEPTAPPVEDVAEESAEESTEAGEDADEANEAAARPAWQQLSLTNAVTGESFTLADFAGKTVYVEPFATWCTNCRQQMGYVNQVRPDFGEDVVFMALSVETNIGDEALAQYAADHGFDFVFAAMSPDLLREMVALFGQTIANPPATPHFIIRGDGSTTELFTGIEGPDAITSHIQAAQS